MLNSAAFGFVSSPKRQISGERLDSIGKGSAKQEFFRVITNLALARVPQEFPYAFESAGNPQLLEVNIKFSGKTTVITVSDITDKHTTEFGLRDSEILFRSLLEQIEDAVVICDSQGRITWANEAVRKMHRIDPVGSTLDEITAVWGEGFDSQNRRVPEDQWVLPRALRGATVNVESRIVRPDKSEIELHVTAAPIRLPDGKIIAAVSIARDISERRQAEKTREALFAKKRRLLEESLIQSKRMEQFVSGLIHELKTPLTPMLGASAMLADKLEDESLKRLATNINRGAQNLGRRLNDLMDLMKGEMGILSIKYENLHVKDMLEEIRDYVMPEAERKQLTLSLEMPESMPTIRADGDRLRQVIFNLLNNAMRFTPSGGHISVALRRMATRIVIEVRDTGCGINGKNLRRLFGPYQLFSKENSHGALGIGLPLSRTLVELHGGRIWAKSRKGEGSTFAFSLPLKKSNEHRRDGDDA
jgi:signal transduction histidine kinase